MATRKLKLTGIAEWAKVFMNALQLRCQLNYKNKT